MEQFKRILIIKWGALGDLIAGTVAIRTVREAFPQARITLLSNKLMFEICPPGTLCDEIIVYDEKHFSLIEEFHILNQLRKRKFDCAVNLRWMSERSAFLGWLSGAKVRVGAGPKSFSFLYTHTARHPAGRHHEIQRNLDVVKVLGVRTSNETPFVYISPDDEQWADMFLQERNAVRKRFFCIHPGASKSQKAWLLERFQEVGKRFVEHFNTPVLVTWGPGERKLAESLATAFGSYGIMCDETRRVGQLAALLKRCDLFLCNCSGPMNVATAVQTPTIALLGSAHPDDWGPYGTIHRSIKSRYVVDHYTQEQEQQAMEHISVEEVWSAVVQRWNELHFHGKVFQHA
jgi:ADP-heptose:LPS heptosyltransferase